MELHTETALVEAVLFLENEPIEVSALSRITGLARDVVQKALETLADTYKSDLHGLELVTMENGYHFQPKPYLWSVLRDRYGRKNENRLSRAALETLSIIAYSQPITRAEIENLRGVSADGMIRVLLSRNLIQETGKKDAPGKPSQYGTTREFLKLFRLSSISELPKLDEREENRFRLEEPPQQKQDE
jgi:segregation and condensation protein B